MVSKVGLIIPLELGSLLQALMLSVLKSFGTEAMELASIKTSAAVSTDMFPGEGALGLRNFDFGCLQRG